MKTLDESTPPEPQLVLTAAQMRAVEASAIASGRVTGLELMERAGRAVVAALLAEWPGLALTAHHAVVLCGSGGNGGDGFVVARLLKARGWAVEVLLYGGTERLPPSALANARKWQAAGNPILPLVWETIADRDPWACDLIIDAVFGIGLTRPIPFDATLGACLPEWDLHFEAGRPPVVAIDLPSGICADSGRRLQGDGLWADLTVTFQAPKLGHFLADGPGSCGRLVVADIGLPAVAANPWGDHRVANIDHRRALAVPNKTDFFGRDLNKFSHGHALILCGPAHHTGAARLAARGALRIGAGLVTLGSPAEALAENAGHLTAIMLAEIGSAEALEARLLDERINALCLGPGFGTGEEQSAMVAAALASKRALVLDADALTLLARHPDLMAALHPACVLTPHGGEFARLFPDIAAELDAPPFKGPAYSKVDATRAAAARAGCTLLYKGADTVIADQSGQCSLHAAAYGRAAPWLATAGAGDVLAGFITGLLARGWPPMQAAETAAWLHVECARSFGPGLIAEDLPEEVPKVLRKLAEAQKAISSPPA